MLREKIIFILLPLFFNVKAVEIYNDGQSTESSWFRNWKKPITKQPTSANEITISNTTPALPRNVETSSTTYPLAIKKTNTYIVGPWGTSEIEPSRTPASIQALLNMPKSPSPPPVTIKPDEPVVEIKPRHHSFSFGPAEASHSETETKWIPISSKITSESAKVSSTVPAVVKAEEEPKLEHHSFNVGSTETSQSKLKPIETISSSTWAPRNLEPKPTLSTPAIVKVKEPRVELRPRHRTFDFAQIDSSNSEPQPKLTPRSSAWVPSENFESKLSLTTPAMIKMEKPNLELQTRHRSFNFEPTEPSYLETELPKISPSEISWTTPKSIKDSKPSRFIAVSEIPSSTEEHMLNPKSRATFLVIKPGYNATELELSTQLAQIEISPGITLYQYGEPVVSNTLIPMEDNENYLISPSLQQEYRCQVKNGFYGVVSNCDKFVECKNNVLKLYRCSYGLHFNRNVAWPSDPCDEPSKAKCEINENEIEPIRRLKIVPTFSATLISSHIDYIMCPSDNGYFRLQNDCEKFFKCENGVPSTYKCLPGLKFNSYASWGKDPCAADIKCKTVIVRPEPELKFSASLIKKLPMYACPKSEGYISSEDDCERFIKCEKNIASLYKCAPGLQFNRYASWIQDPCATESVVHCKAIVVHPPPAPRMSADLILARLSDYTCPAANGYHKIENDCKKFIKCENSIASSYKCNPGLQFNAYAQWGTDPCASSEFVQCKTVIIRPELDPTFSAVLIVKAYNFSCPASEGYYGTDSDCDLFYKCEKSIASLYKCADGMQFNRYATWGQDPCASQNEVRCQALVYQDRPEPKFSAELIAREIADYECAASEGYFKLGSDCDKFIKCEKSIAASYKCWSGLQFNITAAWEEDPCASESIIGCKAVVVKPTEPTPKFSATVVSRDIDFICPSYNGYFNSKNECEQFIKCENAVALLYKCLPGKQFNRNTAWGEDPCASEAFNRCQPVVVPTPPPPQPIFSADLVLRHMFGYECVRSEGYFKLGNECDKFIKCENHMASSYKCWPGLQFNPQTAWGQDPCASESIVGCKAAIIEPKPTVPAPKFSAVIVSRVVFDYVCPRNNGYFESKNECEKFIKCENAVSSLYKCLPGLQFNRNSAWGEDPCASEAVVGCKAVDISPIREPKFSGILISRELEDYRCTEANGYFDIDNNCERFVQCKLSIPSLYMCPNGLQFNRWARFGEDPCANASIVMCQVRPTTTTTTTPAPVLSYTLLRRQVFGYTCLAANGYYSVKDECGQFIECKNYLPSLYKCNYGLYFNKNVMWGADPCALPSIARCDKNTFKYPPTPIEPTENYQCPDKEGPYPLDNVECSKFLMCQKGKATIMLCPPGLVFNAELQACDWPVNVPSCNPDVFHGFTCPALEDDEDRIFKFKYEDSCSKYVACQQGHPRLLSCDKGLSFSEDDQACILSEKVPNCRK